MSTSVRVSDSTKQKLDRLKREGETHDELIDRLVSHEQPIEFGDLSEEEVEQCRAAIERHRDGY